MTYAHVAQIFLLQMKSNNLDLQFLFWNWVSKIPALYFPLKMYVLSVLILCCVTLALYFCLYWEVRTPCKELVLVGLDSPGVMNHPIEKQRAFPSTECCDPCVSLYSQGGPLPYHRALLCGQRFLLGHYLLKIVWGSWLCCVMYI